MPPPLIPLGIIHTIISLVAVGAGAVALARDRKLVATNRVGRVYIVATALSCVTGLFIFQHGGFGKPHALAILTLVVLAVAYVAGTTTAFGGMSRVVEILGLSLTFFFHGIPGVTETFTRLPQGGPIASGPDDPRVQGTVGVLFVVFLVGAVWQYRRIRAGTL